MPLGPKQQAPYYTPEAMPTPSSTNKFVRLNAQYSATQTSGTSETDIYSYTLPGDTLVANGDGFHTIYTVQQAVSGNSQITRFYVDGSAQIAVGTSGIWLSPKTWHIHGVKVSSSELKLIMENTFTGTIERYIQTVNSLDFTNPIIIKFTGQCSTGTMQGYLFTVDQEKL